MRSEAEAPVGRGDVPLSHAHDLRDFARRSSAPGSPSSGRPRVNDPTRRREGLSGPSHSWDDRAVGDRAVQPAEPCPAELAVENERLQRALRARLREEEALRRVATLVARAHAPEAVL